MKTSVKILIAIAVLIVCSMAALAGIQKGLEKQLDKKYTDNINEKMCKSLDVKKFQGVYVQNKSLEEKDMMLYGSSELGTTFIQQHPNNFYKDKIRDYNINIIGRGHYQTLIHSINVGALDDSKKTKKIGLIISPQWFTKEGISKEGFKANFSELQFYEFMDNKEISKDTKVKLCKRVRQLISRDSKSINMWIYSSLYMQDSFIASSVLNIFKPYYYIKKQVLYTLDLKQSLDMIDNGNKENKKANVNKSNINWKEELYSAEQQGKEACTNNEYGIYDKYFEKYIKKDYSSLKGSSKNESYTDSPEFEDLNLFMQICKEINVEPLIISVPVHGKLYDYLEFDKLDRKEYYGKIRKIAESNNASLLDLSEYEYEKYFLCDKMHLGWKGWIRINEGINRYYNEN